MGWTQGPKQQAVEGDDRVFYGLEEENAGTRADREAAVKLRAWAAEARRAVGEPGAHPTP